MINYVLFLNESYFNFWKLVKIELNNDNYSNNK